MHVYSFLSSPFMFVFGDDRVTCQTGADVGFQVMMLSGVIAWDFFYK